MCGFVGILSKDNFTSGSLIKQKLVRMTNMLLHRGPDAQGFYQNDWVALGFNRLSIIDLESRSNQPMIDESGRFIIIYNGEVYNYLEIRKELVALGYLFQTTSDTEVVLKSFVEWQEQCINKFLGMFSFVVVDLAEKQVFAFRDPFGIKPLYYSETKDNYIVVSEIKALRPFMRLEANTKAIYEYLAFRYAIDDETLFKNVFRVHPGCYISYKFGGSFNIKQYYNNKVYQEKNELQQNEKSEIDGIERLLVDSVKLHTRCDVEYGVQLSGGVDSSIITKYVSDIHKGDLHTFSVSFPATPYDEATYQTEVYTKLKTIHHDLPLKEELFINNIEKCIWYYDFPLHDPNNIPFYLLCKMAKDYGIKVLLSGDGADEIFHGYMRNIGLRQFMKNWRYKPHRLYANSFIPQFLIRNWPWKNISRRLFGIHPIIHRTTMNNPCLVNSLVPELRMKFDKRRNLYWEMRKFPEAALATQDICAYLRPWLTRADRMGMAASVELRVPFCNTKLLERLNSLPFDFKLKNEVPKYILKKITQKYFSNDLVWRRKMGFGLPLNDWFRNKNGLGKYLEILQDNTTNGRGIFARNVLNKIIMEHQLKKQDHGRLLWNVLNLELWYRIFIDKK